MNSVASINSNLFLQSKIMPSLERIFLLGAVVLVCGSLKNNFKTHTPRMLADSHETTMFFENQDDKKIIK